MQQLLDKWERLRRSEYLRPDEKLMLNHCISDLKRFMNHSGEANEMNKQQTAVEWLAFELSKYGLLPHGIPDGIYKKAKEMFMEQIEKTYDDGIMKGRQEDGQQYYTETYGGNK
jgi:hypothetical protein